MSELLNFILVLSNGTNALVKGTRKQLDRIKLMAADRNRREWIVLTSSEDERVTVNCLSSEIVSIIHERQH